MRSRLAIVPSIVPVLVLLLALAGQAKEQLSILALAGGVLVVPWSLALGAIFLVLLVRKIPAGGVLVGLVLSGVALLAVVALIVQAPLWVQWRAAPAIAALDKVRDESGHYPAGGSLDGDFPWALRATLEGSGHCVYKPKAPSYRLACLGAPFTRYTYEGATKLWSGTD